VSSPSQNYIREKFADYYNQNANSILPPSSFERREFGFLLLEKKGMLRHQGFKGVDELRSALCKVVPSDVYYSSAYYERPEEEMKAKGWLGADLVFDIDADHIPTPCATTHDIWVCNSCGVSGKGTSPPKCPSCGGVKFKEKTWPCEVCLEAAKKETIKLVDVLTEDFGFSSDELTVAFSGHRGYHVHVESEVVREFDSLARKEIVDYLMGIGLDAEFHGLGKGVTTERRVAGPDLNDRGWRGRVARGTYDFLLASEEDLLKTGLKRQQINPLIKHREAILKSWNKKGPWGAVKSISLETWKKIIQCGVELQSVKIDTVVTPDINRLIRLPNSLHGKTGLRKVGTVSVHVSEAPQFRVEDETYGPYKKSKVEVPTAAALMLLCKGVAKVVQ
jgi:DNA primase small subunit